MDSNEGKLTPTQSPIGGGSSSGGGGGASTMDSVDWRSQLNPVARGNIVDKITKTLLETTVVHDRKELDKVKKLAEKFEEKVFASDQTTSKSDYIHKISQKLSTLFPETHGNKN